MGVNDPKAQPILENAKKSVFDSVLVNTERTGKYLTTWSVKEISSTP